MFCLARQKQLSRRPDAAILNLNFKLVGLPRKFRSSGIYIYF